ncbi:ABC transporter substrate-binding protein [Rhizobium sp. S152]|uniref:ABC transporter substrate-binding protein n=1 Tax=Rhizobium sp. S152 TaxID=3055038 RepID=UPI0025A9C514|nr:ABC transporter substrate-binding protein [Rhizobium sp. S152]MDM9629037.1 ABC transporter substrate-binding protein [Rhizobium sp. S152]
MLVSRRAVLQYAAAMAVSPTPLLAETAGQRIVSLDYGLSSTLLSLGLQPVGISDLADWGRWVVEPEMPDSVVDVGSAFEVNLEILLQLKPDIILTTPYLDELTPRLKPYGKIIRLAIFTPDSGPVLQSAIAATRKLSVEIVREKEAEAFLSRSEAFFDHCRARLAGKDLPSIALVNFMDARHLRIYSSPGLFHNVFERIGVRNAWTRQSNFWGFETIGIEDLAKIEDQNARLVAFDPVPPDVLPKLADSPLWNRLPFFRPGHLSILPAALMFGMVNEAVRFAGLLTDLLEREA